VRSIFESARTERMKKDGPKAADRQLYVRTTTMLQTAEAQKAILDGMWLRDVSCHPVYRSGF